MSKDFVAQLQSYLKSAQPIFNTESQFKPQYTGLALSNLGSVLPSLASYYRAINPAQTQLQENLTSQAQQGLDAGASLDPSLARVTQQSIRGSQAARGLGYGPADVLQESTALTSLGDSLRRYRQSFASGIAGLNNQMDTAPIFAGATSLAAGAGPTLYNSNQAGNILGNIYGEKNANARATAANKTSLFQSMDSNLTSGMNSTMSSMSSY